MKEILLIVISILCFEMAHAKKVNIESANEFVKMAENAQKGILPTDSDWNALFSTSGYRSFFKTWKHSKEWKDGIRRGFDIAFNPSNAVLKDSIALNVPDLATAELGEWIVYNIVDMSNRMEEIKTFINELDFNPLLAEAEKRCLKYVPDGITPHEDSDIEFTILVFDCESRASGDKIFIDVNSASQEGTDAFVDFMAHELHHTYVNEVLLMRYNLEALQAKNPDMVIEIFMPWIMEGTADLLNKKTMPVTKIGLYGKAGVDFYNQNYFDSPKTFEELDHLVIDHKNGKISDETYLSELSSGKYTKADGHVNGDWLIFTIRDEFGDETVRDCFGDIAKTIQHYNYAAKRKGLYQFSPEFMSHINSMFDNVMR